VKGVAERLGPETGEQPVRPRPPVAIRSIAPKRRASLKVMRAPRLHVEHDVVVLLGRGCAWTKAPAPAAPRDQHPPRHAQMHQQRLARVERSARMYFDRRRSRSTRAPVSRSAMRAGKGQRRSGRRTSPARSPPLHHGGEPAADRFDLGQFGHAAPTTHFGSPHGRGRDEES
jgi:hypothetical protein